MKSIKMVAIGMAFSATFAFSQRVEIKSGNTDPIGTQVPKIILSFIDANHYSKLLASFKPGPHDPRLVEVKEEQVSNGKGITYTYISRAKLPGGNQDTPIAKCTNISTNPSGEMMAHSSHICEIYAPTDLTNKLVIELGDVAKSGSTVLVDGDIIKPKD